jgi:cyclohexanone monooxygenase
VQLIARADDQRPLSCRRAKCEGCSPLEKALGSAEQVDWIGDCIADLRRRKCACIEATAEAEKTWGEHAKAVADATLFRNAKSWYVGANIPGKPRVTLPYLGGFATYRQRCEEIAAVDYEGFAVRAAKHAD